MGISAQDRLFMQQTLELAEKARGCTSPNPMVGTVLVQDGEVVGSGYHHEAGKPHAEVEAIRDAGEKAKGATLYVNLEPCNHHGRTPPCTDAIIEAGIRRVVAATVDPNPLVAGKGLRRLKEAGIEVDCGVLEGEARRLNEAFITYHVEKRPFVIAKWAMTLDGRTSTDSGDSRWISNEESRQYAHELRSNVDGIAVGIGTVVYDNPRLNVRLKDYQRKQPRRIIFDGRLRTPTLAKCLENNSGGVTILTTRHASPERTRELEEANHRIIQVPGASRIVNMKKAMRALHEEEIQSILVEGGRQVHTALLRAGLVDKIVVFVGQHIVGGDNITSPIMDLQIDRMKDAIELKQISFRTFGNNACIEGYINTLPPIPEIDDL